MPKMTIAVKTPPAIPVAAMAAGPSRLTIRVSTTPMPIQPSSASTTGPAMRSRARSSIIDETFCMEQERAVSDNPYGKYVEGVDLLATLAETPRRIETMVLGWSDDRLEASYAPEKWSARQILVHLAQCELVFASRLRFGLAQDGYVVQPFGQ